jgi:hypothetical protein
MALAATILPLLGGCRDASPSADGESPGRAAPENALGRPTGSGPAGASAAGVAPADPANADAHPQDRQSRPIGR